MPWYAELREAFDREGLGGCLLARSVLVAAASAIDRAANVISTRLAASRIRLGLVVSYYNVESMAWTLAMGRAGIPSVDVQHGVQSDSHFAYSGWEVVPPGGWELLPMHFWCWSEPDAMRIRRWGTPYHGASAMGQPNSETAPSVAAELDTLVAPGAREALDATRSGGPSWVGGGLEHGSPVSRRHLHLVASAPGAARAGTATP